MAWNNRGASTDGAKSDEKAAPVETRDLGFDAALAAMRNGYAVKRAVWDGGKNFITHGVVISTAQRAPSNGEVREGRPTPVEDYAIDDVLANDWMILTD